MEARRDLGGMYDVDTTSDAELGWDCAAHSIKHQGPRWHTIRYIVLTNMLDVLGNVNRDCSRRVFVCHVALEMYAETVLCSPGPLDDQA